MQILIVTLKQKCTADLTMTVFTRLLDDQNVKHQPYHIRIGKTCVLRVYFYETLNFVS